MSVFELDDQRRAPVHQLQHLGKKRNALARAEQGELLQLLKVQFVHPCGNAANPVERVVVEHDHLPVLR